MRKGKHGYLLLPLRELQFLRQEDDEKRDADHPAKAHNDTYSPPKVSPRVEVSIAHCSHGDETKPERIHKIAVVLRFKSFRVERALACLENKGCHHSYCSHSKKQDCEGPLLQLGLDYEG